MLLQQIEQSAALPHRIPVSGATSTDAELVNARLAVATVFYRSAIKEAVEHFIENVPMDRAKRVKAALASFHAAVEEIASDLEGAIENAVE
jgi:hypothetical protein